MPVGETGGDGLGPWAGGRRQPLASGCPAPPPRPQEHAQGKDPPAPGSSPSSRRGARGCRPPSAPSPEGAAPPRESVPGGGKRGSHLDCSGAADWWDGSGKEGDWLDGSLGGKEGDWSGWSEGTDWWDRIAMANGDGRGGAEDKGEELLSRHLAPPPAAAGRWGGLCWGRDRLTGGRPQTDLFVARGSGGGAGHGAWGGGGRNPPDPNRGRFQPQRGGAGSSGGATAGLMLPCTPQPRGGPPTALEPSRVSPPL